MFFSSGVISGGVFLFILVNKAEELNIRVAALRQAFMSMLNSPEFRADAKKRKAPVNPVPGKELDKLVAEAYATPPATIAKLKKVFGFK